MPLPTQKVLLTNKENKIQLINLIVLNLQKAKNQLKDCGHKLILTAFDPIPMEISKGHIIPRPDLENTHEEADVIIVHQMIAMLKEFQAGIIVMCDETDVFVLLLYYYTIRKMTCSLVMELFSKDRICVDIKETAAKHSNIITHLLPAHALTGCDTVAHYWGIGKTTVVKILQSGYRLYKIGDISSSKAEVVNEATLFMAACYGVNKCNTMTDVRQRVWRNKTGRANIVSAPKLQSLPPTNESFELNVMRAHLQACIWKHAGESHPPVLDPLNHGWKQDTINKRLVPVMLPSNVPSAPDYILKLIKCSCKNCATSQCSCVSAGLPCTIFCRCEGADECLNSKNVNILESKPEDFVEPDQ
jgi:hypothetical protein